MTKSTAFDIIGKPVDRVDGRLKVTGAARYAAEYQLSDLVYGAVVQSTVAKGRIESFDSADAEKQPGVLAVYSCFNQPMTLKKKQKEKAEHLFLLQNDEVAYCGQIIGLVVATSFEAARDAAASIKVTYSTRAAQTNFWQNLSTTSVPAQEAESKRGDFSKGLAQASVKLHETYTTPTQNHNPMEPFATIASWDKDSLTLYDTTQAIFQTQQIVSDILGIAREKIRIVSNFVGGGFGSKLLVWPHVLLAAMAARKLNRPVKVVLSRHEMYGPVGFRPNTHQEVMLGATDDGRLTAIKHVSTSESSTFKEFLEIAAAGARSLYACQNVETRHRIVKLDIGEPTWMRAPGHCPGSFALESAMDELAHKLDIDPIELRLRNFAEKDQESGLPWSSNSLRECYRQGAERFGWSGRNSKPGARREGKVLIGMGMATAMHSCWRNPASVRVRLLADGTALVQSGSQDIGTGTYTVMTQIAAERLGLKLEKVRFELGDSNLPKSPMSGGSTTSGSLGPAVALACDKALDKLIRTALADKSSPLSGSKVHEVRGAEGVLATENGGKSESYAAIIARTKSKSIEVTNDATVDDAEERYSMSTFGAQFAEVRVDADLGTIRVSRFVGAYGAGRILNPKTARSQMLGGIVFGVGMALMEHTLFDHNLGRIINADLAEYHVPVHADIGHLDPFFVKEDDEHVNVLGIKGVGELGITGAAAAIANAVFNATGKRIRDLPITLDKLL